LACGGARCRTECRLPATARTWRDPRREAYISGSALRKPLPATAYPWRAAVRHSLFPGPAIKARHRVSLHSKRAALWGGRSAEKSSRNSREGGELRANLICDAILPPGAGGACVTNTRALAKLAFPPRPPGRPAERASLARCFRPFPGRAWTPLGPPFRTKFTKVPSLRACQGGPPVSRV
jgi:hypothetical protein